LFKFKTGDNFNHRNTLSILRIAPKLHFVQNVEPNAEIGQKGAFCKGLRLYAASRLHSKFIWGYLIKRSRRNPADSGIKIEAVIPRKKPVKKARAVSSHGLTALFLFKIVLATAG